MCVRARACVRACVRVHVCGHVCGHVCLCACKYAYYIFNSRDISCVSYEPSGMCKNFTYFNHPVTFAVNTSRYRNISTYQDTFTTYYNFFLSSDALSVNKRCLDALIPFLCRSVFITCDPAFNQSVEQRMCRRACETVTKFVCPEVTTVVMKQNSSALRCDDLMNANGGDAPDCIDPLDGGWSIFLCIVYKKVLREQLLLNHKSFSSNTYFTRLGNYYKELLLHIKFSFVL